MDFQRGDVGYVQQNFPHLIENTGDTDLVFLEMFKDSYYQDVSLTKRLTHLPPQLVLDHLKVSRETLAAFPLRGESRSAVKAGGGSAPGN
jgi:oxalate decarboxylase